MKFLNILMSPLKHVYNKFDNSLIKIGLQYALREDLKTFFYLAMSRQKSLMKQGYGFPPITYYEFGVGMGGSLIKFISALKMFCKISKTNIYSYRIFGFDSFEGLPEKKSTKDDHKRWEKGQFSKSLPEINKIVHNLGIDLRRKTVNFIKGYFEDVLTPTLREELKDYPPTIINIDCDYYSSTKIVLEWLKPMLISGTIFYFDDIWGFDGHPNYGQLAALREFNEAGGGILTPYPSLGLNSRVYIYSRKEYEFKESELLK